jgi:hypothetical protein
MEKKLKQFVHSVATHTSEARSGANAINGPKPMRRVNGASALFLNAGDIPAGIPPCQRAGHARRLRQVRVDLRSSDQHAVLYVPEIYYWFVWQRRVLFVNLASRLLESKVCSLNAAARLLGVSASWLCTMLQKVSAGGNAALIPSGKTPLATSGCRLSVYLKL